MNKLHFGCFDQVLPGWTNTDVTPHLWIARVPMLPSLLHRVGVISKVRLDQHRQGIFKQVQRVDLRKRFPYREGEFGCAFSAHVLEHLYYEGARNCLREVHRVLAPGGILRVSVPDLDLCVSQYDPSKPDDFCSVVFEGKHTRDKNRHHWMYNENSMRDLLLEAGFAKAYRCQYRQGQCPEVETIDNRPESLFMEAVK